MTRRQSIGSTGVNCGRPISTEGLNTPNQSPRMTTLELLPRNEDNPTIDELRQDFCALLLLLRAICPLDVHHVERCPASEEYVNELRDFLDSFSYLCDIRKGGGTVTAAAIRTWRAKNINILWLAANEGVGKDVKSHAEWMVAKLKTANESNGPDIENSVFTASVKLAKHRIQYYKSELFRWLNICLQVIEQEPVTDSSLRSLLIHDLDERISPQTDDAELVMVCYDCRGSLIDELRSRSTSYGCFSELAHFIGRLGAHWFHTRRIVEAALNVPSLRNIWEVCCIFAPKPAEIIVPREKTDPGMLVRGICTKIAERDPPTAKAVLRAWADIDDLDVDKDDGIRARMMKESRIKTRVHAELMLHDLFSREKFEFLFGDRYVGCSKAACYFCYHWINLHHNAPVGPASHNTVLLGSRGPDFALNDAGRRIQERMYKKMIAQIEQDITKYILDGRTKSVSFRNQHMSSNGSNRATSIVAGASSVVEV